MEGKNAGDDSKSAQFNLVFYNHYRDSVNSRVSLAISFGVRHYCGQREDFFKEMSTPHYLWLLLFYSLCEEDFCLLSISMEAVVAHDINNSDTLKQWLYEKFNFPSDIVYNALKFFIKLSNEKFAIVNDQLLFLHAKYYLIHISCRIGDEYITKWLLDSGVEVNERNGDDMTPIVCAVSSGKLSSVKLIVEAAAELDEALLAAVYEEHSDIIKYLLEKGAKTDYIGQKHKIKSCDFEGLTAFQVATLYCRKSIVELLFNSSVLQTKTPNNDTCLHLAAKNNKDTEVALFLLERIYMNFNSGNNDGLSVLHVAALNGRDGFIKKLIARSYDINVKSSLGDTALHMAAQSGHKATVELLIKSSIQLGIHDENSEGLTPLHYMVISKSSEIFDYLVTRKTDFAPLLFWAVKNRRKDVVEFLISKGVEVDAINEDGYSSVFTAAEIGCVEIGELLLDKGALLNFTGKKDGFTPLLRAVKFEQKDFVEWLLENDVTVNHKARNEETALHLAVRKNSLEIVKMLIEKGADMKMSISGGWSPLHVAVVSDLVDLVEVLLKSGCCVNRADNMGFSPLHLAVQESHPEVVTALIAHGSNINQPISSGKTPLHIAARTSKYIVQLLINSGASLDSKDNHDLTPLHEAVKCGQKDIIEILLKNGANVNSSDIYGMSPLEASVVQKDLHELFISFVEISNNIF